MRTFRTRQRENGGSDRKREVVMDREVQNWFQEHHEGVEELAKRIFEHPELSGEEEYACSEIAAYLRKYGFETETYPVAPAKVHNGLTAKWGSGYPVIAVLGEYDALPGLGQKASPKREPLDGPGHGCGHNLMGAGCAAGAVAAKQAMEAKQLSGTIRYYGCPAEEGLAGKVQMLKMGCFADVDLCIAWHTGGPFRVCEHICQSMISTEFHFYGITAHAACAPQEGRSALDAAQLMNVGVEFLREHIEENVRIHYVFGAAGERPNVVPAHAAVKYYIRSWNRESVDRVFDRVCDIARGAALMSGTTVTYKIISGGYEPILNFTLNAALYESMQKVPDIVYDENDYRFAEELYQNYNGQEAPETLDMAGREHIMGKCGLLPTHLCKPLGHGWMESGSTDVNDVSQVIPTVQLFGGGVMGVGGHSWGVTASSGSAAGRKAAVQAGKYIAQFCIDVLENREVVEQSKEELWQIRKGKPEYSPILATDGEIPLRTGEDK